ncbi:c-type cytochrome [Microvirga puerhi]|uniref:Cytochrome c n=1 Tax=Microvirga puerhi TaxID=2876078 RepID=A0ABS7VIS5_9HYPH|nr:cytochrome c [Microvirga puerhi]MBZ6075389.1 cytochrome c [Microvirga puerhi]
MKRSVFVAGILALGVTAAIAQADVIAQRQKLMKDNGDHSRVIGAMLKDQAPFDLAQVQTALKAFSHSAKEMPQLFPANSKDGKTKAQPAVWEKKSDFDAHFAQFGKDAEAALASIKDSASFKAEMPKVLQNCGTCHKTFRQPVG